MDLWSLKVQLLVWTLMSLLSPFSLGVAVRNTQLKPCGKHSCVTDLRDCDPRPPPSQQTTLNMSCFYEEITNKVTSLTCDWTQESDAQSHASLIFTSKNTIFSCRAIFNPTAVLGVTVRMKTTQGDIWSQPHTISLSDAVKPPQPVLTVLGSTEDSLVVSWNSSVDGSCRLRYRLSSTHTWTQISGVVPVRSGENLTYTIRDLLPFQVYGAAVSCREFNIWSNWSSHTNGRTLDKIPPRPSEVCYRVEKTAAAGSLLLHLKWKTPDPDETKGRILGYQVTINPRRKIQNVTEMTALLVLEEGNYSVAVQAFNTAGFGAPAHLQIDTHTHITIPSVRNLWISSDYPQNNELLVQWTFSSPPSAPPVSHVFVEWRWEKSPSTSRWSRVDGVATSAVIRGLNVSSLFGGDALRCVFLAVKDVDPKESYLVSVFPVSNQLCGPPQSLTASLQQGALMEAVNLNVISVTKTTITIMWAWQQKSGPIRVNKYRATLTRDSDIQTLSLWPDQWQHTFFNLTPNTDYSLFLLADNVSRNIIPVATYFDEVPVVATATPLLLLAVIVTIISVLSRTAYKSYFFPPISNPRFSTTGQWLMNPNLKKCAGRNILDIGEFEVIDALGNKSLMIVDPNDQISLEDQHEDTFLSISSLDVQISSIKLDSVNVCDTRPITEQQLVSLQPCHREDAVLSSGEDTHEVNSCSPQKEDDIYQMSDESESAVFHFRDFLSSGHFLTDILTKPDAETTDCSYMTCETAYLSNGCISLKTCETDKLFSSAQIQGH